MKSIYLHLILVIINSLGLSTVVLAASTSVDITTTEETATESPSQSDLPLVEQRARAYLREIETRLSSECHRTVLAEWAFASNITDENQKQSVLASVHYAQLKKDLWKQTVAFPWEKFTDDDLRRQFRMLAVLGTDALPSEKLEKFTTIVNDMQSIYGKAKVCSFVNKEDCSLSLEPDLKELLSKSRNYEELEHLWLSWRDVSGKKMSTLYPEYVDLLNEAARMNGLKDAAELWLLDYESTTFQQDVYNLWKQVKPLYDQLHAYVRRRLRQQYGSTRVSLKGPIPAHILGDMWAQRWSNVLNFTVPFPDRPSVDVSPNMIAQNYTAEKMFKASEEFFQSVNLTGMPKEFWTESIIEKPNDRDIICHASAWDFCNGIDFRIKQCTKVNMNDFITVHHEMGHVEYFILYKNQPFVYRNGANPGFHEAVGDLLALSVSTPKHLKHVGLLESFDDDEASNVNYLYSQALEKVSFIPSALVIDQWRWDVFTGKVDPANYNCHWWKLRSEIQGVRPPRTRMSTDFDPGAKYHVPSGTPYIRYFVSHIIQFQMHKALCIVAGQYDPNNPASTPLHKCDIYRSQEAGMKLRSMLSLGSSRPWTEAMYQLTGERKMDASALLEYFSPLFHWLREDNAKNNETVGWQQSVEPICLTT